MTGAATTPAPTPATPTPVAPTRIAGARAWIALATVLAATFMGQVDGFIVNVASPTIQRELPAGFDEIQLIGAVFVFACAAGLVIGGRLGDRFGRRRVFLAGVAVFTLASLMCGVASDPAQLIGFRLLQGAAAAVLIPQELAIIRTIFDDDNQRARALGAYGVVLGLGVIGGIAGGGVLVDLDLAGLGWRAAFLVNVPIGVVIVALGRFTIDESRSATTTGLDVVGAALTMVTIPALLVPLILGPRAGWSGLIWICALIGLVTAGLLVTHQRRLATRGGEPLYPPHVVTTPGFRPSLLVLGAFFAGNAGLYLVFTYHLQTGLGLAPITAGLLFAPVGIGFAAGSAASSRLAVRFGSWLPVIGTTIITVALIGAVGAATLPSLTQRVLLSALIAITGFGQGLVVAPLVGAILGRFTPDDAGAASGVASTVVQFGLAFGFTTVGLVYSTVLGGIPGDPTLGFAAQRSAFIAAAVVLAVASAGTGLACVRLRRQ